MPATVAVPTALPVKVTEQLPVVRPQLRALRDPPVVPADNVNVTVPVGVMAVPAAEVSVTVAVHTEPWLMTTVAGAQTTAIAEVLTVTVIVLLVLVPLPL